MHLLRLTYWLAAKAVFVALWLGGPPVALCEPPADERHVKELCGACHNFPEPGLFAKRFWKLEVEQGYNFYRQSSLKLDAPSEEAVLKYYESHAPQDLAQLKKPAPPASTPFAFRQTGYRDTLTKQPPAVGNVHFVHLYDDRRLDVLACDMLSGQVLSLKPYEPGAQPQLLAGGLPAPCHAEVVDLDGDGIKDVLVSCLGVFFPSDETKGRVALLKGSADGSFTPITLASGLGRVADVQVADFNGDGKLDLIVAEFGWRRVGQITYYENRTKDWLTPEFVPHVVDSRHGAIHVPVADLNHDGRPDFVALISQEHETVVAFLNDGKGGFRPETIYAAPQPAWGSSGIQLVDLDGDGDLDVLMTNGDSLDRNDLRPWHGVSWLENRGKYPFVYHRLTDLYGAHRAVAADFDGDGDLDIIVTSFLPDAMFGDRCAKLNLDSVILLEQTKPGVFVRHSLETVHCDHITCDAGDFDGDGKIDLVMGNFINFQHAFGERDVPPGPRHDWFTIWKNVGRSVKAEGGRRKAE